LIVVEAFVFFMGRSDCGAIANGNVPAGKLGICGETAGEEPQEEPLTLTLSPSDGAREQFARGRGQAASRTKTKSARLLAVHSPDSHAQAIETFAGSDKQRAPITAAEADVGRPRLRDRYLLDFVA